MFQFISSAYKVVLIETKLSKCVTIDTQVTQINLLYM